MKRRSARPESKNPPPPPDPPPQELALFSAAALPRHQYSPQLMALFVRLVLSAPTSQRAAAAALKTMAGELGGGLSKLPCANAGRLWLMRLGLYALTCAKPAADDWLWLLDHTVQLGPWKCLVIVGVRLSAWQALERPLRHEDLALLNLTPMQAATKEAVAEQLEQTRRQVGLPAAVLSDEGTELKGGMELFRRGLPQEQAAPPLLHDIKHKAAGLLKKELHADPLWGPFVQQLTRAKQQLTLTELALLNPPRLRNKARFMNLECVVKWGRRGLALVQAPEKLAKFALSQEKLEARLGWLRGYEQALTRWAELLELIAAAEEYVRRQGYHAQARAELAERLARLARQESSQRLRTGLLDFVQAQSAKLPPGRRVLGHTEVLESLLGKYKQTQGRHSQGGMTAALLNIGAIVSQKAPAALQQALAAVPVKAVLQWVKSRLGQTIASQRRQVFQNLEQNPPENTAPCPTPF